MILAALLLAAGIPGGAVSASPGASTIPADIAGSDTKSQIPRSRLPGFAAMLAAATPIIGPSGWPKSSHEAAWMALAAANPATRQSVRWAYARSLIAQGRGADARGVLEVMRADDGDLALVANFQLALGAALVLASDPVGAITALGSNSPAGTALASNPEACSWRLLALVAVHEPVAGLRQIPCARPALIQRRAADRAPFLYAGARASLAAARPAPVTAWLAGLSDNDTGANLYRGQAALALGDKAGARLRLARVSSGTRQQQLDASVSLLEANLASGAATPAQIADIDNLVFVWRGDAIEQRALELSYRIGLERHDLRRALAAGAAMVRYGNLGARAAPLLEELRTLLAEGLAPDSKRPIVEAAGLFWDYRDLAPAGSRGDFLASQLADRLQAYRLYERAADLLRHQLLNRAGDIAQGPLSLHVASLYILAGKPAQALAAIDETEGTNYPGETQWDRNRIAAVALFKLGRRREALAVLQDVPDGAKLRAEIAWKSQDWKAVVAETGPNLPMTGQIDVVDQANVLRYAIGVAMLGDKAALAKLRARYTAAFATLPAAGIFNLLTVDARSLDTNNLATAMLAIPSASPAGPMGDLMDAAVVASRVVPKATKPI